MSDMTDMEDLKGEMRMRRAAQLRIEAAEQRRRDRFDAARSAMQGLLAQTRERIGASVIARESVIYADALLAELEKGK